MKEAFERPIAESNNGQKRNELEFHTLKFWFLYAYCIIIIIIIIIARHLSLNSEYAKAYCDDCCCVLSRARSRRHLKV